MLCQYFCLAGLAGAVKLWEWKLPVHPIFLLAIFQPKDPERQGVIDV